MRLTEFNNKCGKNRLLGHKTRTMGGRALALRSIYVHVYVYKCI